MRFPYLRVQHDWLLFIPAKFLVHTCVAAHNFSIPKSTYKRFERLRKSSFAKFCCRQKVGNLGTGASELHAAEMSYAGLRANDDRVSLKSAPRHFRKGGVSSNFGGYAYGYN
jgi:hypothetical protein